MQLLLNNQQSFKPNDIHTCPKHRAAKCPEPRTTHITNQKYISKIAKLKLAFQGLLTAKRGSLHQQTVPGYSKSENAEQAIALSLLLLQLVICEKADLQCIWMLSIGWKDRQGIRLKFCHRLTCSNALRALLLTFLTDLPGDVTDCLLGACSEASGGQSGRIKARREARSEASTAGLKAKL